MMIIANINTKPNDYCLSEHQQKVILALRERPKTAKEIENSEKINLSTIFKALEVLKEKGMVTAEKKTITGTLSGATVTIVSDVNYWELTKKGLVWARNLAEAYKKPKKEIDELTQKIKAFA